MGSNGVELLSGRQGFLCWSLAARIACFYLFSFFNVHFHFIHSFKTNHEHKCSQLLNKRKQKEEESYIICPFSQRNSFSKKKSTTTQQTSKYSYTNQPRLRLIGGDALCLDRLKSNGWKLFKMDL